MLLKLLLGHDPADIAKRYDVLQRHRRLALEHFIEHVDVVTAVAVAEHQHFQQLQLLADDDSCGRLHLLQQTLSQATINAVGVLALSEPAQNFALVELFGGLLLLHEVFDEPMQQPEEVVVELVDRKRLQDAQR